MFAELRVFATVERVPGFDWGVHGLLTAVVLGTESDKPIQISRPLFVKTGGLDGHQACTRRKIDELKAKRAQLVEDASARAVYDHEISHCWRAYEARNQQLAHLAANLLLLFAAVWGCSLVNGESLKPSNRLLRYKSHLLGWLRMLIVKW